MALGGGRPAKILEPPELIEIQASEDPVERIVAHHFGGGLSPVIEQQRWSSINETWIVMRVWAHIKDLPEGKHVTHKCVHYQYTG